ncbi:MAG: peptidyl-prolyl cis-trans isomerase A (cyclophilin A) [Shewanella sp.]|jgi:peptidyl-prolyl cis-trans isomerase A (cyclophilin A)
MNKLILSLVLSSTLVACGGSDSVDISPPTPTPDPTPVPELAADVCYLMETSMGKVKLAIDLTNTPITGQNFKQYVDAGFYDGMIFHRVIEQFMAQTGGFTPGLVSKEGRGPIVNESDVGISNTRGTLAMARTSSPNSATSQFFINAVDNDFLDKENAPDGVGYAVFGQVIEGMEDVMDQIDIVDIDDAKDPNGINYGDVPVEDIVINKIAETVCPSAYTD